ncbi:MAG: hypothetical protein NTX29_07480, partial [Actinobacteria bacterium]|nr:hypothetical protein [Actinomycetota bacterium]
MRRIAAVFVCVGVLAGLLSAAPASAAPRRTPPIVLTVPAEALGYSSFPLTVDVANANPAVARTAALSTSWDQATWTPVSTWAVKGKGSKKFSMTTGETLGRLYLRVT